MDYKIVYAQGDTMSECSKELEEKVKTLIADGWLPIGSIAVSNIIRNRISNYYTLAQSMIKNNHNTNIL